MHQIYLTTEIQECLSISWFPLRYTVLRIYLADVAGGVCTVSFSGSGAGGGGGEELDALVPPGEPVCRVHGRVASAAQRGLVGAAQHRRRRPPARVATDLHPTELSSAAKGQEKWKDIRGASYMNEVEEGGGTM